MKSYHTTLSFSLSVAFFLLGIALMPMTRLHGEVLVWQGSSGGDWFAPANWQPAQLPAAGDEVIVTTLASPGISLTNSTPQLASLALTNAWLTAKKWGTAISATNMIVAGTSVVTCDGPFLDGAMSNRVHIVASNLLVNASAGIKVNGRGFSGGIGEIDGHGPGKSKTPALNPGGGAGHGGVGGVVLQVGKGSVNAFAGGTTYNLPDTPLLPGSGSAGTRSANGGHGGGAILLEVADSLVMDGEISANGLQGGSYSGRDGGGGSGGAIWINCATLQGNGGKINAKGANSRNSGSLESGGGGGGRIAVHYDKLKQAAIAPKPLITFSAAPGTSFSPHAAEPSTLTRNGVYFNRAHEAGWGTLWFSDHTGLTDFSGTAISNLYGYIAFGQGFTNITAPQLTLENCAIGFQTNFTITTSGDLLITSTGTLLAPKPLTLQVSGDMLVTGEIRAHSSLTLECDGDFNISGGANVSLGNNSSVTAAGGLTVSGSQTRASMTGTAIALGGDLYVTSSAWLALMGYGTMAPLASAAVRLGGDLTIDSSATLYIYGASNSGGTPTISCRNLHLPANGTISGKGRGYAVSQGPGKGGEKGTGTGAGGGYGGKGGNSIDKSGGVAYGVAMLPQAPGSGGGTGNNTGGGMGGNGGSLVFIRARETMTIDGAIDARGNDATVASTLNRAGGGGAGGGITLLSAGMLKGAATGKLCAAGGSTNPSDTGEGGGGGGGRIAVWEFVTDTVYAQLLADDFSRMVAVEALKKFDGSYSVAAGVGYQDGEDGTVGFYRPIPGGTVLIVQ